MTSSQNWGTPGCSAIPLTLTQNGLWKWTVMSPRFASSPGWFQSIMLRVREGLEGVNCSLTTSFASPRQGTACVQPATVPRTANEIRSQTCKALLGAVEIISLDTRYLQRACTLILTRSKPLNVDARECQANEIATRRSAAQTRPPSSLLRKGVKFEFTPHHERIVREI